MNLKFFLEHFDLLCEASNSAQQLRELTLSLAFMGKLVTPCDGDEPASLLVNKSSNSTRVKISEPLPPIMNDEIPFHLPPNWAWLRLGDATNYGSAERAEEIADDKWVLDLEDIEKDTSRVLQKVRYRERQSKSDKFSFKVGDVLYGKLRPYLNKVVVADDSGVCTTEIIPIRPVINLVPRYLMYALKRPDFLRYVNEKSYGMKMPRLGTEDARMALLPVAPLNEQHSIVAKVDQFMSLCDVLEEKQQKCKEARITLNTSALDHLLAAKDPKEFDTHWKRISTNFDLLYDKPETVITLRQAIIQLAVQGRLVPQNPKDEKAGILLERVKKEKHQLVVEKKTKNSKLLPAISGDKVPYELPNGWEWAYIDECYEVVGGIQKTPMRNPVKHFFPYLRVANVYRGRLDLGEIEYFELDQGEIDKWGLKEGDLLVVEGNGSENEIGRCAIWKGEIKDCVHQNHIIRCRPIGHQFGEFTLLFLNSLSGMDEMKRLAITTSGLYSLSVGKIRGIIFPIPPIDEQRRILHRVNELMGLCSKLEASLLRAQKVNEEVLEAIIKRTVDA